MNIVVTGGSGRIGRYVVREFADAGHTVTNADLTPWPGLPGKFLRVDLTDAGQVYQLLAGADHGPKADAVVHLGAWPNAGMVPDTRTYGENVQGAFNIFQACANLGIQRVISASTNQIYGFAGAPPVYLPADETHPLRPVNCYALSKIAGEQAAAYFVANNDMTILSFRFMGVRIPEQMPDEIAAMAKNPASGSWLLWTRTDARDAALACRLAVEAENPPSGAYNITGAQVVLKRETRDLVREFFGDATEIRDGLAGHVSPLSCAKAERAFGYRPRYVWNEDNHHLEQA